MKRFDKMNVLDNTVEKIHHDEELENALDTLDSAVQQALQMEEKVEAHELDKIVKEYESKES